MFAPDLQKCKLWLFFITVTSGKTIRVENLDYNFKEVEKIRHCTFQLKKFGKIVNKVVSLNVKVLQVTVMSCWITRNYAGRITCKYSKFPYSLVKFYNM